MNYEGFIIYCFHIETCHVYDITTNESLIEYKASVMNSTSGAVITTRQCSFSYPLCERACSLAALLLFVHNVSYSIFLYGEVEKSFFFLRKKKILTLDSTFILGEKKHNVIVLDGG